VRWPVVMVVIVATVAPAAAGDGSWVQTWLGQLTMTGNWYGAREALRQAGITPTIVYTTDLLGNPVGGQRQGAAYTGALEAGVNLDLERLLGINGLTVQVAGVWSSGSDLSDDIGNIFPVAEIFAGDRVRLYTLFLEQMLFGERISIKAGRFATTDDFLTLPVAGLFVNSALDPSVYAVEINVPGATAWPIATWGGRIRARPVESLDVSLGAFYSDPALNQDSTNGTQFGINTDAGYFIVAEVGYRLHHEKAASGLRGHYRIGAYYDSNRYPRFTDPASRQRGNYGVYALADQMVLREGGPESDQGLTVFAGLTLAPAQSINTMPWFAAAGLVYRGLLPARARDTTGLALYYGGFSRDLPGQTYEMVLEWTYAIARTPWLTVQPDIQYVMNPSGRRTIKDALVVGAQLLIQF
jgi:porin